MPDPKDPQGPERNDHGLAYLAHKAKNALHLIMIQAAPGPQARGANPSTSRLNQRGSSSTP